ncbi:MAG TPA: AAA domain-containing protein [Candidatus Binatia bacterium]|nr:AAA domain-containing protein [Candidatus Binatia bacterium]
MDELRAAVAYWLDCVKSENALEQSFGMSPDQFALKSSRQALLFDGSIDPFIFDKSTHEYVIPPDNKKTYELIAKSKLKEQDLYFGYPLLMYYDRGTGQSRVAPLFVIRLQADYMASKLVLSRADPLPSLGHHAFEKLGLRQEEIVALNKEVVSIFEGNKASKLETILYLLGKETNLTTVESIDPAKLSEKDTIHAYQGTIIYNKAILFASEASVYNLHLLNDLEGLVKRHDLSASSLRYLNSEMASQKSDIIPVLPFAFDEHQLLAIQDILGSDSTVITGPPGTGKSQFIANLIINLFLQGKKVLLVSHTGEAVRVVNERINNAFSNLIMETGKKETRQDLGRRLEAMVALYNEDQVSASRAMPLAYITRNWQELRSKVAYLKRNNSLHYNIDTKLNVSKTETSNRLAVLQQLKRLSAKFQLELLISRLDTRQVNYQVLDSIQRLKAHHIEISREYVRTNYLNLILGSGDYGKLLAYIDAVQSKKFTPGQVRDKSERYIDSALQSMNVWSCTLKSLAATFPLQANLFDYVIFDEASQIDLPSAAPALYRAKKVVVVGDENQLNHIAKINAKLEEELAEKHQLNSLDSYPALTRYTDTSLFNSAKRALKKPERELRNHYRSHARIANLFSTVFYGSSLKIYEPPITLPDSIAPGVFWIDVKGTVYKHKSGSKFNTKEVDRILDLLQNLLPGANQNNLTIGIATPYSKQQEYIAKTVMNKFEPEQLKNVRIMTVHKFQGSEADIMIFSPVIAGKGDGGSDHWFISNKEILNVAVSRAKQLLLIVGDQKYAMQSQSKLKDIALYCIDEPVARDAAVPNRTMNIFEKQFLDLLKKIVPKDYAIEPQSVVGNRFTLDFALKSKRNKIAIELDGRQHEIIGGLPVFEDQQRDTYLKQEGWQVMRVTVHDLLRRPDEVARKVKKLTRTSA